MPKKPVKEKESMSLTSWGIIIMVALVVMMTLVESFNPPTQARQVICKSQTTAANLTPEQKAECEKANRDATVFLVTTNIFLIPLILSVVSVVFLKKKWGIYAYGAGFVYSIIIHIIFKASYSFIIIFAELVLIGLYIWVWRNKEVT
jgi:hypothetical protein